MCDFRVLPDVICAPGELIELSRKHRICCPSDTQGGPWANKERLLPKPGLRAAGRGVQAHPGACLGLPHQTGGKAGWSGENQIQDFLLIPFLVLFP